MALASSLPSTLAVLLVTLPALVFLDKHLLYGFSSLFALAACRLQGAQHEWPRHLWSSLKSAPSPMISVSLLLTSSSPAAC